jgi:hypothetical protein
MPSSGFFDRNTRRTYPFVFDQDMSLPDCAIVDFGCTMLGSSGFIPGVHKVWLEWIRRINNKVEYSFRTDAPGLLNQALIFQRNVSDPDYVTEFTWAQDALTSEEVNAPCECGGNLISNWDFDEAGIDVPSWTVGGDGDATVVDSDFLLLETGSEETADVSQNVVGFIADGNAKIFIEVTELVGPLVLRVLDAFDSVLAQLSIHEVGSHALSFTANDSTLKIQLRLTSGTGQDKSAKIDFITAHNCTASNQSYSRLPPDPEICQDEPFWEGFLVTGNMECVLGHIATCQQDGVDPDEVAYPKILGPAYVEPATIQALSSHFVRSFAIANADRTRATTPDECRDICWPFAQQEYYVMCECVAGNVRFLSGYNMNIRQETTDNMIIFDAEVGGGLGEPCVEQKLFIGETSPPGRSTLSGSLLCSDIVRSINGVSSRIFLIQSGDGVRVTSVPAQHRVIIDVDMNTLALCPDVPVDAPVECLPPSSNPCDCGPTDPDDFECPEGSTPDEPLPTTPAPNQGGPCVWEATVDGWEPVSGACGDGFDCVPPGEPASSYPPGHQLSTGCFEVPLPPVNCLILNNEFNHPLGQFYGWGAGSSPFNPGQGVAKVVNSYPGVPNSEMPMVLLEGTAGGHGALYQELTIQSAGNYRLQMDLKYIRGNCIIRLESFAGGFEYKIPQDDDTTDYRVFLSPVLFFPAFLSVTLSIIAESELTMTGRGAMLIGSPCLVS